MGSTSDSTGDVASRYFRDPSERLLEDIRAAPDDDDARLVWADAVGGERGELVVLQIELERGGPDARGALARRRRQRELLARHGAAWSGLAGWATRASYRRGFVDALELRADRFLESAAEILAHAPFVTAIAVVGLDRGSIDRFVQLCGHPMFAQVRGLDVVHALSTRGTIPQDIVFEGHGDEIVERLVAAGLVGRLGALGIRNAGEVHPDRRLLDLGGLERLLVDDFLPAGRVRALFETGALPAVHSLAIDRGAPALLAALPATIRELAIEVLDDRGLAALVASPVAAGLERLSIADAQLGASPGLASLPGLRALELRGDNADVRALAAETLPALTGLRELALRGRQDGDVTRLVAQRLGPRLDLLDLRHNPFATRYLNDLKPHVAGELLVGERGTSTSLLRLGRTTQLPWWDHVML